MGGFSSDRSGVFSFLGDIMIKRWIPIAILLTFNMMPVYAQKKENERVASAGRVMSEILRIPDNIPSDLLQKAVYDRYDRWNSATRSSSRS